ncbi:TetR family transcriptional regulator [Oscillatoria sp. FACHB-1406]|uniref:TetR family transcriptional regulator n=1 Tax=Oscillatoria sp. FACHB-1406 TaxID=2692846 RepID=UPI001688AEE5|nr:TetR family transcriptional regulator [Oscillatoria sp. FACHB-1406]MBD2576969.1 TetR family transcriptional regulator [Oscillatoria sp. FACHB-1406]
MPNRQKSTRIRLIQAALELFASKGITETTTKAVAERAQVNEVTLFRHFGNKQGLLLAVLEETEALARSDEPAYREAARERGSLAEAFEEMAEFRLQSLERVPELVRSLIGEAGQSPEETRQALGRRLTEGNRYVANYFASVLERVDCANTLPLETLASLFNTVLLGYFLVESTSEGHQLWRGREEAIASIVQLFLHGAIASRSRHDLERTSKPSALTTVSELPSTLVHTLLQRARKRSRNDYAWMYVLFAAGLSPEEIASLTRSHLIREPHQCVLQVNLKRPRQVPLDRGILGKRYGSNANNPLTQWLKSRKDSETALFLNEAGQPLSAVELRHKWQVLTSELLAPDGYPPRIEQARQTWCLDMLAKGIDLEDLSILSGLTLEQLQPYLRRAREKAAIERASRLGRSEI